MKLPRLGRAASPPPERAPGEYTIDELARSAGTTVRNVRAYQDRGLLPAPEKRGRSAIYGEPHRARLRIIGTLLARGYTLNSIGELLGAWEQGQDIGALIGLESAVSSPWTDEEPRHYTLPELAALFGGAFSPQWLARATELGVLKADGVGFVAPSPRMIQAGAALVEAGIPLDEMLEIVRLLRANVEAAAEKMVQLVERHVFDRFGPGLPPPAEAPRLGDLVWRLRPLVEMAVHAEVARAMEHAANKHLGDRLAWVLDHLHDRPLAPATTPPGAPSPGPAAAPAGSPPKP